MVPAETLAALAGVAVFAVPGAGLAEVLPGVRSLPVARRLAYGYLLGIVWTAGGLFALSHLLSVPLRPPAILAVAGVPALAGLILRLRRGRSGKRAGRAAPRPPWERVAIGIGIVVSLSALAQTLYTPQTDWDGRMTWAARAKHLRAEGTVDASVLTQPGWFVTHPWYPLLLPVAQVAVQEVTGAGDDQPFFRPLYAAFLPVWLLLIHHGARRAGSAAAAWAVAAAALLPFPVFFNGGGAVSSYSDMPLACFYGGALLLLLEARPRLSTGIAAGLLLAGAVLAKAEGTPMALAVLALAALPVVLPWGGRPGRLRRWRLLRGPLGLAALPPVLAMILLWSWRAGIPQSFEDYRHDFPWSNFGPEMLARIPFIYERVRFETVAMLDWGIFWSVAPLVLLAGWRGLRRRRALALLLGAAAPLALAWFAYSVSREPGFFVATTWNRFLVQASVPCLVLLAFALGDLLRRVPRVSAVLGGRARSRPPGPPRPVGNPPSG
ncbi:MAG TPA: hypothetical protein VLE27_08465 [Thermoanaerobaculia bacterium]|nr:hypothetical protein [Thermoanaerobaculia bacterium]